MINRSDGVGTTFEVKVEVLDMSSTWSLEHPAMKSKGANHLLTALIDIISCSVSALKLRDHFATRL